MRTPGSSTTCTHSRRPFSKSNFPLFTHSHLISQTKLSFFKYTNRFGFIRNTAIVWTKSTEEDPFMFIHSSGGMFVLVSDFLNNFSSRSRHASSNKTTPIKSSAQTPSANSLIKSSSLISTHNDQHQPPPPPPRIETPINYSASSTNDTNESTNQAKRESQQQETADSSINICPKHERKGTSSCGKKVSADSDVGFWWSWNFMLGKRWRSQYTGDESLQDNILADFRLFCSNSEGRLRSFYDEIKSTL